MRRPTTATANWETPVVEETVVHDRRKVSPRKRRAALAAVMRRLPEKVAADTTSCTVQAVRHWKAETRSISSDALLDLATDHDIVWKYVCTAAGRAPLAHHADPQTQHVIHLLQIEGRQEGPRAEFAREMLRKIMGEES